MRKTVLILGHDYKTQFVDIFNQYTRVFDQNHYEVTVAYLTGEPDDDIRRRTLAEEVLFLNFSKQSIRNFKIKPIIKLLSLTKQKKFEIVITHRYKPTYIMMWVAKFTQIPRFIAVMHEFKTMQALGRQLLISCLRQPETMLFAGVSNAVRDDLRKSLRLVPKNKIITLYNMIDVELIESQLLSREEARRALGLPDQCFIFGNLARLVPNKDHLTLLRAFAAHKTVYPHAKLVIAGLGPLENNLKNNADSDVIFTGFLPCGFKYLKAFDCFVLSSIQEAFGRVLLEAMVAKVPIIATRIHGIPEVVGDIGELVEASNPQALGAALVKIFLMPEQARKQVGCKAYDHACKNFSITKFHTEFWQLPFWS